jgi:ankyrin repeat protein
MELAETSKIELYVTKEKLKRLIYIGQTDEFRCMLERIMEDNFLLFQRCLSGMNDGDRGLLHWASMQISSASLIPYLLDLKANINQQNHKGQTALSLAVDCQHLDNAKRLLVAGADPDLADYHGNTPLHVASMRSEVDLIKMLCQYHAKWSYNKLGQTPFHIAAKHSLDAMRALIKYYSVELNECDSAGNTPLHHAATDEESDDKVMYLLILGADKTLTNSQGETPLQVAEDWDDRSETCQTLKTFARRKYDYDSAEVFYQHAIKARSDRLFGSR